MYGTLHFFSPEFFFYQNDSEWPEMDFKHNAFFKGFPTTIILLRTFILSKRFRECPTMDNILSWIYVIDLDIVILLNQFQAV